MRWLKNTYQLKTFIYHQTAIHRNLDFCFCFGKLKLGCNTFATERLTKQSFSATTKILHKELIHCKLLDITEEKGMYWRDLAKPSNYISNIINNLDFFSSIFKATNQQTESNKYFLYNQQFKRKTEKNMTQLFYC